MAKAIFHRNIEVRSRKHNVAWSIKASPDPQCFPRECIDLAVEAGAAEIFSQSRQKKSAETPDETGG